MYEPILTAVVGALAISLITFIVVSAWKGLARTRGTISLKLLQPPPNNEIKLWVRHVLDGKDEVPIKDPILLNKNKAFQKSKHTNEWSVSISYSKNIGFQFKCFVDYSIGDQDIVMNFLGQNGFAQASKDGTLSNRTWFLLPKVPTCETSDHYINNFFHPGIKQVRHEA